MRLFQINYKKLIFILLPGFLRSKFIGQLMVSAVQPLIMLYNSFTTNRNSNLYKLSHNGQVCYLRKVLNDAFPNRNDTFKIIDIDVDGEWQYSYAEANYNQFFAPQYPDVVEIFSIAAIIAGTANFLVIIPNNLIGTDTFNQIRAIVNEYKLISKKPFYEYSELP